MRSFFVLLALLFTGHLGATTIDSFAQKVDASLFMDFYYTYDFNDPVFNQRPEYIYSYNQHNQVGLNMALAQLKYAEKQFRMNLGIMAGTYPAANLRHEPTNLQHIYEASISMALNRKRTKWLTAGVFESHMGIESVISTQNMTLTRSLSAENSPYYQSGIKYSNESNDKLIFNAFLLNGWQRIRREPFNSIPAIGTQLVYQPKKSFSLNWSTYLGSEGPDSNSRVRFFNNIYSNLQLGKSVHILLGVDLGFMKMEGEDIEIRTWYSPTAIFEFSLPDEQTVTLRLEHYHNTIDTDLSTTGMSLGYKRLFFDQLVWRFEMRFLNDYNYPFENRNGATHNNSALTTSLALLIH